MALATGFNVPDVDCLIWLRPTKSPVLYVQGFGRGTRIAPGKTDCLVLDFTDTVERMGPVDTIKGKSKRAKSDDTKAPHRLCPDCGERVPVAVMVCPTCGHEFPPPEPKESRPASNAAILSMQIKSKINTYPVTRVHYSRHWGKQGKPDSMRVDYWSGMRLVVSEWVCYEHEGFARAKAEQWTRRTNPDGYTHIPGTVQQYLDWLKSGFKPKEPAAVVVNETGKFPELIGYQWQQIQTEIEA